jgi:hypothetical protein
MAQAPSTAQGRRAPAIRWSVDVRTVAGAVLAVLALRVALGLWLLAVSAFFPSVPQGQQVGIVPEGLPTGQWLQRAFVQPWIHYDAWNYIRIADHGYRLEDNTLSFHPLYPLLAVPFARALGGNIELALLVVSTLACVLLCVVFARYVAYSRGDELWRPACWFLLLGPLSFILLAPYTESTFLALAVASMFAMRRERWALAGIFGGLAALTRQQGLVLVLPMAWGLFQALRERRTRPWSIGALALIPLGYGIFIIYRVLVFGDFSAETPVQGPVDYLHRLLVSNAGERVVTGQRLAWPWELFIDQVRLILMSPVSYHLAIDLVLGWALILVLLFGLRDMHMTERLYSLGVVVVALCYYIGDIEPYMALPRHIMIAFPLFIVLSRWAGRGSRLWILIQIIVLVNFFLASLFVLQGWVP